MITENNLERIASIEQNFEGIRGEYPKSIKGILFPTGFGHPLTVNVPHKGGKPAREGLAYMAWLASGTSSKLDVVLSVMHIRISSQVIDQKVVVFHVDQKQAGIIPNTCITMYTAWPWMGDVLVVGWDAEEEEFLDLELPGDILPAMDAVALRKEKLLIQWVPLGNFAHANQPHFENRRSLREMGQNSARYDLRRW
ncbi:hypothetical protein B0H11DRAFT_1898687 [Mycena galericulata]|nr:hypothetical protein B0H11DRAFT_1898687 [Mycena galericulata]